MLLRSACGCIVDYTHHPLAPLTPLACVITHKRARAHCTQIEALRCELDRMAEADPSAKAIVFSQFTSFLDLAHFRLEQVGVRCVKLEGSMSLEARARAIEAFSNDPSVRVFLMSLKAGERAMEREG